MKITLIKLRYVLINWHCKIYNNNMHFHTAGEVFSLFSAVGHKNCDSSLHPCMSFPLHRIRYLERKQHFEVLQINMRYYFRIQQSDMFY